MICTKCNEDKLVSEFYTRATGTPCNPCKACRYESKLERIKDPEYRKKHNERVQAYKKTDKGKASVKRHRMKRRMYTDEEHKQMKDERIRIREEEKQQRANEWQTKLKDERERKLSVTEKVCRQCGDTLHINCFYKYPNGMPRLDCKECLSGIFKIRDATRERKEWRNNYRKEHGRGESEEHRKAWSLVASAEASGKLIRPSTCPQCGSTKHIQAHHPDYSKPLNVVWLCQLCHKKLHQHK